MAYPVVREIHEASASEQLAATKTRDLRSRYTSNSLDGAIKSAGRLARINDMSFYVYAGNYHGSPVWRSTFDRSEALCPISNSGARMYEVTPGSRITKVVLGDPYVTESL